MVCDSPNNTRDSPLEGEGGLYIVCSYVKFRKLGRAVILNRRLYFDIGWFGFRFLFLFVLFCFVFFYSCLIKFGIYIAVTMFDIIFI